MMPYTIKIQINRENQALFKYIFESYENLATVSTLNPSDGIIEVYIPAGNLLTVEKLLEKLQNEINFQIIEKKPVTSDE